MFFWFFFHGWEKKLCTINVWFKQEGVLGGILGSFWMYINLVVAECVQIKIFKRFQIGANLVNKYKKITDTALVVLMVHWLCDRCDCCGCCKWMRSSLFQKKISIQVHWQMITETQWLCALLTNDLSIFNLKLVHLLCARKKLWKFV